MTDFTQPINWGVDGPYLAAAIQVLNAIGALTLVYAFRYGQAIVVSPLTNAGAPLMTAVISLVAIGALPGRLKLVGHRARVHRRALARAHAGRRSDPSESERRSRRCPTTLADVAASMKAILDLIARHKAGEPCGIYSVCSAHPLVIEATLRHTLRRGAPFALIEATSNQVNQEGGYTGMKPAGFRELVHRIADRVGLPRDRVLLGGDHLGPNAWQALPVEDAMARAEVLIDDYVRAGFRKIHLDCSMSLRGRSGHAVRRDDCAARRASVRRSRKRPCAHGRGVAGLCHRHRGADSGRGRRGVEHPCSDDAASGAHDHRHASRNLRRGGPRRPRGRV